MCLDRLGAGVVATPGPACEAELQTYRACLAEAAAKGGVDASADPDRETAAKEAYFAVKAGDDPEALRLVAKRFQGTFWADLAGREADKLGKSAAPRRPARPFTPIAKPSKGPRPLDPIAGRMMAGRNGAAISECVDCPAMIALPAGSFVVGSPSNELGRYEAEGPQRRVTLRSFAIARDETTFGQWRACAAAGFCRALDAKTAKQSDDAPVRGVSWADVTGTGVAERGFLEWLNVKAPGAPYRLPSEAEWEYAARAGGSGAFPWGDEYRKDLANGLAAARFRTRLVGSYPPNAFGLRDMHGNVLELTEDCWNRGFRGAPTDGTAWKAGRCDLRVLKGGAYLSEPRDMRSASRGGFDKDKRGSALGFRVVRDLVARGPQR